MRLAWEQSKRCGGNNKLGSLLATRCKECCDLCNITQHYAHYTTRPASLIAQRKIWLQLPTQIRLQSYPKRLKAVCGYSKDFLTRQLQGMRHHSQSVVATMNLACSLIYNQYPAI